jgi:uncharacterized membrane protein YgdD (TMEM256/DUF423 family)
MKGIRKKRAFTLTGIIGAAAVGLGAFGAHGLEDLLVEHGRVETWETAAFYHLVHSVVLLVLVSRKVWRPWAWTAFATGITVFSGSLYVLSLSQHGWLGAITPIGGILLIAGWISLAFP